ncbi:MAG: hypothetical protein Q4D41_07540 [Prevotellaceae bacterium]|nr:hypothetical protein [Prevotellaceae bacterium]
MNDTNINRHQRWRTSTNRYASVAGLADYTYNTIYRHRRAANSLACIDVLWFPINNI